VHWSFYVNVAIEILEISHLMKFCSSTWTTDKEGLGMIG
jgi:hypothetical protein